MKAMIRLTSLTSLLLALLSGAALFWVSQQVQQVEREQRKLVASNVEEEEAIRVLKAEWDYLNRPERLEELSSRYLNMAPASADTLVQSISAIPEPEDTDTSIQEQKIEVSTAQSGPGKTVAPPTRAMDRPVSMAPPTLGQNTVSGENSFGQVLDNGGGAER